MKMARSHIPKKSDSIHQQLAQEVKLATDYIKQWTTKELGDLQRRRIAVCVPTKTGYRIGLYTLRVFPNKHTEVWNHNNDLIHVFQDKVSAVLYTIYTIKHNFQLATQILNLDAELNKHYTDILLLRRYIESACKRGDYGSADVREARLHTSELKLQQVQEQLKLLHRQAKANKVWD
jgi:hypothetical protein